MPLEAADRQSAAGSAGWFSLCKWHRGQTCRRFGLAAVSDERIWQFAKAEGFSIVSMDEDFRHLSARFGFPPKVVWVRLGNVRRQALLGAFAKLLPELRPGLEGDTAVIEIR